MDEPEYIDFQRQGFGRGRSSPAKDKGKYIQGRDSYDGNDPVKGLIVVPGPSSPGINVGDIGQQRHNRYQRIGLHIQNICEYVSLREEAYYRSQPHLGLVVDSHESCYPPFHYKPFMPRQMLMQDFISASILPEDPLEDGR